MINSCQVQLYLFLVLFMLYPISRLLFLLTNINWLIQDLSLGLQKKRINNWKEKIRTKYLIIFFSSCDYQVILVITRSVKQT